MAMVLKIEAKRKKSQTVFSGKPALFIDVKFKLATIVKRSDRAIGINLIAFNEVSPRGRSLRTAQTAAIIKATVDVILIFIFHLSRQCHIIKNAIFYE